MGFVFVLALLCVSSTACDALIMTGHAIDPLSGLCKDQFANVATASLACEARRVVGFVPGHDSLMGYGFFANSTVVRTCCADWGSI